jgi:hypothetical protein
MSTSAVSIGLDREESARQAHHTAARMTIVCTDFRTGAGASAGSAGVARSQHLQAEIEAASQLQVRLANEQQAAALAAVAGALQPRCDTRAGMR